MKLTLFALLFAGSLRAGLILCHGDNPACPDAAAWAAQVQGQQFVETFTGGLLPTTEVSQVGGTHGFVLFNTWFDSVVNHPAPTWPNQPLQTTTFSFVGTPLLWGFGGNFDTSPGFHASGIAIEVDGLFVTNLRHQNGDFFGVIADDGASRFSSVTMGTVPACWTGGLECTGWELLKLDNLRFAVAGEPGQHSEVPEPGTWAMLLIGLAVLAARKIYRYAS